MKLCITCKVNPQRGSGSYCKACHNEYQKAYYKRTDRQRSNVKASHNMRRLAIQALVRSKKDVPCMDCGVKYPYYVMDFDHVRGEKKFLLAKVTSSIRRMTAVIEEMAKCDVVCANCHRERTWSRMREH